MSGCEVVGKRIGSLAEQKNSEVWVLAEYEVRDQ